MFIHEAVSDGIRQSDVTQKMSLLEVWDMEMVKEYLVQKGIYTPEEVNDVELEYKRFLALTIAHRLEGRIPICQKVDDMWHGHILFTQDYHAMCNMVNGGYIHHRPCILDGGPEVLKGDYENNTRVLYEKHFGDIPKHIWEDGMQICVNCCFSQG